VDENVEAGAGVSREKRGEGVAGVAEGVPGVGEAVAAVGDEHAEVIAASSGGCVARAGSLVVDNSFDARARRFEPVWRAAIAEMYRP